MKLIFEKSYQGRGNHIFPSLDVEVGIPESAMRNRKNHLPEISENEIVRHYTELAKRAHGVNTGFYPLGSCTMKHNPKVSERVASNPKFVNIHPLQPIETTEGCREVLKRTEEYLCEITGMDAMTFQPAAGAHGEFTGMLLIKAYHKKKENYDKTEIIVPDSAHGTNPASAVMAGFEIVNIKSDKNGMVDLKELEEKISEKTAGIMLTNPNTVGLFDNNILKITQMVHDAGGLCYYDGANLNAVMGIVRPGDVGFDVTHLNIHKTFSTPHGGGGPGSGPCGCKEFLRQFLPGIRETKNGYEMETETIGNVTGYYGNFLVVVKALAYLLSIGSDGVSLSAKNAVLNANYMMHKLKDIYDVAYDRTCMHEFVLTLEKLKEDTGVSALDISKALLDYGIHPPTMYFPLIVHEALMIEPTETESKEVLNEAILAFRKIYEDALKNPDKALKAPISTPVGRLDEVQAARKPVLRYEFES
ncbi:MAG: aminomethyl-transferring glycine dehydrogenase subunit GcvPB [Clostridiales bacterium]|nr:aminomethyl-transferring glycine dehydrogenase subunit GcvPB [Clostridiales bacterium]